MRIQHINPHPLLKGYIEKMWVFESNGRVSDDDLKLIVPNGLIKLVIPFRNGLSGTMEGCSMLTKQHGITLIGLTDIPSVVDAETDSPTGTIGVEFSPRGAYRFFHIRQCEIRNKIHVLADIMGKAARMLERQIADVESTAGKVDLLQRFLLKQFMLYKEDNIFEYCIGKIQMSKGGVTINQLERETGYSSRWLNMKFQEKVGVSPKNLSSIIRFQKFYQALANNSDTVFLRKDFYNHYYDQSHFIKDFKRFTGLAPTRFENSRNDFGKIFYKS